VRAARCLAYGPPENVVVEDVAPPELGPADVRVKVAAASVNFPDVLLVAGTYQITVPVPFVPGSELAGEVAEVGDEVADLSPGQRVFGTALVGAFAEEAVVPATSLTVTPDAVSDEVASAFGVAHRTAFHVLRSVARLREGEELVVLGAGGGVGLAAVQLGRALGARVTAVASTPEKLEVASGFGAERLVNHREGDLRQSLKACLPDGADVVVDPVGGALSEPALRSLRYGGRFVTVGYASGTIPAIPLNLVLLKGVQIVGFQFATFARHEPAELQRNEEELLALLASGRASPHIGARFNLEDAGAALRYVADGRAVGKVVLSVAPAPPLS
jgi:NADPH:quinone reductase